MFVRWRPPGAAGPSKADGGLRQLEATEDGRRLQGEGTFQSSEAQVCQEAKGPGMYFGWPAKDKSILPDA